MEGVILIQPVQLLKILEKSVTLLARNHGCEDLTFRVEEGKGARHFARSSHLVEIDFEALQVYIIANSR